MTCYLYVFQHQEVTQKLSIIYLIFNNKVSPVAYDLKPRAAPGIRPAGIMTGLRGARWTGTGEMQLTPANPRKRVLELSGGVGSLPQAPRWNADRRARPSLPLPVRGGGREIRRAAASQMRTEGLRVCRRFAFLILLSRARSRWSRYHRRRPSDGIGPGVFRGSWSKTRARRAARTLLLAHCERQRTPMRTRGRRFTR